MTTPTFPPIVPRTLPPTFPPIGYAGRLDRVRASFVERRLDGLLITDLVHVRWVSGFTGSFGSIAVTRDAAVLVTDGRYRDRAVDELAAVGVGDDFEVRVGTSQPERDEIIFAVLGGFGRVGAEAGSLTHARWEHLRHDVPIEPDGGLVAAGRRVKDRGEVARIEFACACADRALAEVAPRLGDGMTEVDVRNELEYRMRLHGADGPSYSTIVASGPSHAARPHHEPTPRPIVEGDTVVIDVGALVDGYHSDMTRSYVVGEPSGEQAELYEVLHDVQQAGLDAVAAGVPARDVDAVCRSSVADAGYGDWYLHSTGHGVGLEIHEDPYESPTSTETLVAGDVVTVEPGLYRVGFGGFRIEDLVEVTEGGCRVLTGSPKDSSWLPSRPTT